MNTCLCGCGVEANRRYIHGHNRRGAKKVVTNNYREFLFWKYVGPLTPSECWDWIGHRSDRGYGYFRSEGKSVRAHRFSYEFYNSPINEGLTIDHLCRNRGCVNPTHLEAVSFKENISRATAWRPPRETHCPKGHEYTISREGRRYCRICGAMKQRERRKK